VSIDGQTQLVGVIGWPVAHSLSPAMHNGALTYAGLNWRYVPLPVRPGDLESAIRGLAALGFRGFNVTVPHKVDIIPLLDNITEAVNIVGAVNTVRIDRNTGHLEGMNTDMTGILVDLASNNVRVGKETRVLILGAGGAARAVAAGLLRSGAHIIIANRTFPKAQGIVRFLQSSWPHPNIEAVSMDDLKFAARDINLIINTTPVGMWPDVDATPWPEGIPYPKEGVVYDTVYRPQRTRLMRDGEAVGMRAIGGIGMLVHQGAAAYEVWTGKKAPVDVMRMICLQELMES
jgi:shikimate dehydrogenase